MIIGLSLERAPSSAHPRDCSLGTADSTAMIGWANQSNTSHHPKSRTALLTRVMRLVCFRLGRFFGRFFLSLEPLGVKNAGIIDPLVRMRAKEIALRLQEISGKASRAITVVIRQRGRKRRDRYAELDSR